MKHQIDRQSLSILFIFLSLFFLVGCEPSYEEKRAKKEQERKEAIEKQQHEEKQLLSHLTNKYKIIHFPPSNFKDYIYTYELQKYFENKSNNYIVFRGYLEDLEKIDDSIFIEFSCPLSEELIINQTVIAFRLKVTEKQATAFLNKERVDSIDRLLAFLRSPDYLVVAEIKNISKIRKYELSGSPIWEDEVEINIETPTKFVATGNLIDAVEIPKSSK